MFDMKTTLVTAFEPFGGRRTNASLDVLKSLPARLGGWRLEKATLPVEGRIVGARLRALIARHKPALVVSFGLAAGEGSVRWMFERKGVITINLKSQISNLKNKEELEMEAIEAGAEDISWDNDILDIYTKVENLETAKKTLEGKGLKIDSAKPAWIAKETVEISDKEKESCQKLFEALDENDTVQEIYSNLRM